MKKRCKLPHIVSKFYNEILVQFGKRTKVIQSASSDNALEHTQPSMSLHNY